MIGIVLAGGSGTRLAPLTLLANKHALPLGNVPMIHHSIDLLAKIGISRVIVVCGDSDAAKFMRYLKDGSAFGVSISYTYQDRPGGIAEALGLCRAFAGGDQAFVVLADNGVEYVDTIAQAVRELGHPEHWRDRGESWYSPPAGPRRRLPAAGRRRCTSATWQRRRGRRTAFRWRTIWGR